MYVHTPTLPQPHLTHEYTFFLPPPRPTPPRHFSGHIAASPYGYSLLHEARVGFVTRVADLAMTAPCLSLRGACFNVMCLLARSEPGRRALSHANWACYFIRAPATR